MAKRSIGSRTAIGLAVTMVGLAAQEQPPPSFRAGVSLVLVDVSVVDGSGQPVVDLSPGDFTVRVSGKPRRVARAELVRYGHGTRTPDEVAVADEYSSNEGLAAGRSFLVVVDQGSFFAGQERSAVAAGVRFIDTLAPGDRVAVAGIPTLQRVAGFDADRRKARQVLAQLPGMRTASISVRTMSLAEAFDAEGGGIGLEAIVERECLGLQGMSRNLCRTEVQAEARTKVAEARADAQRTIQALVELFDWLRRFDGPKVVVFISQGLVLQREVEIVNPVVTAAAAAGASLHVLHIAAPLVEVSESKLLPRSAFDLSLARHGLDTLAAAGRGRLYPVVALADNAFARIVSESSAVWQLGIEPDSTDLPGRPLKLDVKVSRRGVDVRTRPVLMAAAEPSWTPGPGLDRLVRSPELAVSLPVRVATHVFRDGPSGDLRVLVVGEFGEPGANTDRVDALIAGVDQAGRGTGVFDVTLTRTALDTHDRLRMTRAVLLPPQTRLIKVAAVDSAGRAGSVVRVLRTDSHSEAPLAVSDLVLSDHPDRDGPVFGMLPIDLRVSRGEVIAYLELYGAQRLLRSARVEVEVVNPRTDVPVARAKAKLEALDSPTSGALAAVARVPLGRLQSGPYKARARVTAGGTVVTSAARSFTRDVPGGVVGRAALPLPRVALPPLVGSFAVEGVLAPPVVDAYVSRLAERSPAAVPELHDAIEAARRGKFPSSEQEDELVAADSVAASFLRGLALLDEGRLEAAALRFREALREDAGFLPAMVYLGACYAGGGKDREAAAAWQTSLIDERQVRWAYLLLGDAQMRLGKPDAAVTTLEEASMVWHDDTEIDRRRVAALYLSGRRGEAAALVDKLVQRQPQDADTLWLGFRVLISAAEEDQVLVSDAVDRERAVRYARAYVDSGAEAHRGTVTEWLGSVDRSRER